MNNGNSFLSFSAILVQLAFFALVNVGLEKPVGSISGRVSLEKPGFHLHFSNLKNKKVYALAILRTGPGNDERGVWVKPDGTFQIDHLPAGEYSLRIDAPGYSESERAEFVNDGTVTKLEEQIYLEIMHPSVQIASNRKTFTSEELPYFWINCVGATKATVKLYKTDILKFKQSVLAANKKAQGTNANQNEDSPPENNFPVSFSSYLSLYKNYGTKEPDLFRNQKPAKILNREIETKGDQWVNAQFKLNSPLVQGDYVGLVEIASVSGEKDWDIFWFSVTDLGLIVKHDKEQLVARAVNLINLQPVNKVKVQLESSAGENDSNEAVKLGAVSTGADGLATIHFSQKHKTLVNSIFAIGSYAQSKAYCGVWSSGESMNSLEYKTYFYTERPIYRLGQTTYFKGIVRELGADGFHTPAAGLAVKAIIEDPSNNKVWQGTFKTNDHGSFHGLFNIPDDGKTGAYQLTFTYPDGNKSYNSFEVAQYRKPEYEVVIKPTQARVIAGQKITAQIKATYYFGAPVANARIKYSVYAANDWGSRFHLMPRPKFYGYFDDWDNDDDSNEYSNYSGGGDFISEGTAQTDANGEAIVEIATRKIEPPSVNLFDSDYYDKRYKIEAEVTDLSRMSVISSGYCSVTAGSFALFVQPESWVVNAGKPIPVSVKAVDYEGHPIANQSVNIKLSRLIWDSNANRSAGQELAGQRSVTTDAQGKASLVLDTKGSMRSDTYFIGAQAQDSSGNLIYDQSSVWISSDNYPYVCNSNEAKKQSLQIKLDKFAYKPGDIAKAVISAPLTGQEGAQAIVAVEGTKIHKLWIVPMRATAKVIDLPIRSEYSPNVYVTVTLVGKEHQYYNQSKIIRVSPKEHFLNIVVSTDKEKYSPGETVKYTIKTTDQDEHPIANAELSFGLVDESIYAIRNEVAENIQKFFYNKRPNWVQTYCTFDEEYSGGPDKTELVPTVRKDFRDTAVWLPNLKTNSQGIAIASVKLPDNLTTWRATIRGITAGTDVGSQINKIISTQDLIVRLSLPRFFSLGDETSINAVVHNYTGKIQPVDLTLAPSPQFAVNGNLKHTLTVLPDKAQRFSWPVKLVNSGLATVSIKAVGKTAADAMETKVNVLPLGIPAFAIKSGELLNDPASTNIAVGNLSDACLGTYKHRLSVAASSIGPVLGNFDKLIDYPYGCTEQTISRLMPSVVAMTLHKKLDLPIDKKQLDLFAKVYKRSMAKLTDYQHEDGGWGWWQTDDSNPYLTSLVLQGFYQLQQVGYAVDAGQIKKGTAWLSKACNELQKQLTDPKRAPVTYREMIDYGFEDREQQTDLATMIYALSLYNIKPPAAATQWLLTKVPTMSPEALCYLTLALKHNGDHRFDKSYKQLMHLAEHEDQYAEWDHTRNMLRLLGIPERAYDYTYRFTGVETTALSLQTVLAVEPENTALIEAIKRWLLVQRDGNGWSNTKTTAQVFLALLQEQVNFNQKRTTNETLKVAAADQLIKQLVFDASNRFAPEEEISIPAPEKQQMISLNKSGPGRVYYNSLITYTRNLKAGENIAAASSPAGLSLERSFYRLVPLNTDKGYFRSERIGDNIIHAGETVLMKIKVDTPISLPYVILQAYLPSGAEIVEDKSKENVIAKDNNNDSSSGSDWGAAWWTHQDILDDRIVFFGTELPAGKSEFSTLVRMEMPGNYQINPLNLEGMYAKNVRAYSSLGKVQVTE